MDTTHFYDGEARQYRPLPPSLPPRYGPAVLAAYARFVRRQTGRERPAGTRDSGGRWDPAEAERRPCCAGSRSPSRRYPWSLYRHAFTARHVAALEDVDARALRSLVAWLVWYAQPAPTAPAALCPTCGASWSCDHRPWLVDGAHHDDPDLLPVPDHRADMSRHVAAAPER